MPLSQSHTVTHRLRIRGYTAQSAFNWVDLTFRWSRPPGRRCSYVHDGLSTFFAVPRSPPSQGCGPSGPAISRDAQQRCRAAWSLGKGASHQSLQPTCCHEHPQERPIPKPQALTIQTAVAFFAPRTEWGLVRPGASRFSDAGKPLLACPALGSQAVGAASAGCYRIAAPEGKSGVPLKRPCGRCQPNAVRATRIADASCRTRFLPRHPELVCKCQDLLPRAPPRARLRKPEAPSTNRSHRRVRLSPASDRMGRHWCPSLMPRTQLPTCFHAPPRER